MDGDRMPRLDELPVACTLDEADRAGRLARWRALAENAQLSVERTPDQLVVRYGSQGGVHEELEALVAAERECGSFAEWEVSQGQEHVILRIRSDARGLAAVVGAFGGIDGAGTIAPVTSH